MLGYFRLNNQQFETVLKKQFPQYSIIDAEHALNKLGNPIVYYYDKINQIITLLTPVNVCAWPEVRLMITQHLNFEYNDFAIHWVAGLIGMGVTEQHIVTVYFPAQSADCQIYDSKASNPERFFSERQQSSFTSLIKGMWLSILPRHLTLCTAWRGQEINYNLLGTQSFFDGKSCGFQANYTIQAIVHLINLGFEVNRKHVLEVIPLIINEKNNLANSVRHLLDLSLVSFIKKAWLDTFLYSKELNSPPQSFREYFMGWPANRKVLQLVYILSLSFIRKPLINIFKLFTEFLPNLLVELNNYVINQLINWMPTFSFLQYTRSGLLLNAYAGKGFFKSVALVLRVLTSPFEILSEAWQIHPLLGVLSAVLCISGYIGFYYFLTPLFIPLSLKVAFLERITPIHIVTYSALKLITLSALFIEWIINASSKSLVTKNEEKELGNPISLQRMDLEEGSNVAHQLSRPMIGPERNPAEILHFASPLVFSTKQDNSKKLAKIISSPVIPAK